MEEKQNMEKKIKHLEMIESIIERMGNNSFQLKGWAVTLVTIVGALAAQGSDKRFFLLAFIPLVAFWCLDSFYLQMERKYKVLYKNVCDKDEKQIDFNMDTRKIKYSDDDASRICFFRCMFSPTECTFYLIIGLALSLLAYLVILR